jgi:hypothetical protein
MARLLRSENFEMVLAVMLLCRPQKTASGEVAAT